MKILKIIFGILFLLALIFFGRGLLTPSLTYSSEITVDKPLKEAWEVMQDESRITEWLQDITNVKHVSGTKGTVGAVTEYTFDQNGMESTVIETIKSITENKQIQLDFDAPGAMDMAYQVDFSEKDGKTHIKSTTVTEGKGFIMRSLLSFMKGSMVDQENLNMSNLQKMINENTTNYFPVPTMVETESSQ